MRVVVCAVFAAALSGCIPLPPPHGPVSDAGAEGGNYSDEPIPGIEPGFESKDVVATLGPPKDRASGWWIDSFTFDMNFTVWYYKGTGRVIFNMEGLVYASEADPSEDGRSF